MSEQKYLEVSATEKPELEKGESGLSSASIGTVARESRQSESAQTGVNLTNLRGVATGNTEERSLRVTRETPSGVYIHRDGAGEGFSRSVDDKKQIVNMILVNEVKKLIAMSDAELKAYFDKLIEDIKKGQYVEVDTTEYPTLEDFLESTGEQGTVYLYPVGNSANNYYQYIWENGAWKSLGTTELDLSDYAKLGVIAPKYSETSTYTIGAKVTYNGKLYTCLTAITEAESWTASHWTEITVSSGFIDADSDQVIGGNKTFSNQVNTGAINSPSSGNLQFKIGQIVRAYLTSTALFSASALDLGTEIYKIRDIHLSGKIKDGTNEWDFNSIGFPVIPVPASTTLTVDEKARIVKGARINGSFLGYDNIVFFPALEYGGSYYGTYYVGGRPSRMGTYAINGANLISLTSDKNLRLEGIDRFNGKAIPAYPSNTGTFVLKCVNGTLTWVQE